MALPEVPLPKDVKEHYGDEIADLYVKGIKVGMEMSQRSVQLGITLGEQCIATGKDLAEKGIDQGFFNEHDDVPPPVLPQKAREVEIP